VRSPGIAFFHSPPLGDIIRFSGAISQAQRKAAIVDASIVGNHAPGSDPGSVSSTLLERLKARRPEAWQRLVDLYGPLIYRWCRWSGVPAADAPDVVQEVFIAVATHITDFHRQQPGDSFSGWMRTITRNKVCDHFRRREWQPPAQGGTDAHAALLRIRQSQAPGLENPPGADAILPKALELVRAEFENRTWEAFWRAVIEGQSPAHVAEDLGMSVQAVYKAKSRVLRRLREELGELL
jgi:RNA polymerase sigma-70 factor (ECF subfamily)